MTAPGELQTPVVGGGQASSRAPPRQAALRLDQLPPEVLQRILAAVLPPHTDTVALAHLALVSRAFRRALQGPSCVWRGFCLQFSPGARKPEALLSLARWLRPRCAQLTNLELLLTPDSQLEAIVALLAPRLEAAALRGRVAQAAVDQLAVFGSGRLAKLELGCLLPSVQLEHLSGLAGLRTLHVSFFQRQQGSADTQEPFPFALCALSQLTELWLDHPDLDVLPDALSRLASLRQLTVRTGTGSWGHRHPVLRRVAIEAGLGQLRSLTALRLHHCILPGAWPSLSGLTALAELELEDCTFVERSLPAGIAAAPALTQLTCRSVAGCGLTQLQPGELSSLASLKLAECMLDEFPAAACHHLRGLTRLDLSHNRLDSLPRAVVQLVHLRYLSLAGRNPAERGFMEDEEGELVMQGIFLPVDLARLSQLEILDLRNAVFTLEPGLAQGLADLPMLDWLCLHGALPCRHSVLELVMLGVCLEARGRLGVLQWW